MARLFIVSFILILFHTPAMAVGDYDDVQVDDGIIYEVPEPYRIDTSPKPTNSWMTSETKQLNFGPYCIRTGSRCEPGGKKQCCDKSASCAGQFPNFTCKVTPQRR